MPTPLREGEDTLLLKWLQDNGVSDRMFARMLGCSVPSVGFWAHGRVLPGLVSAFKIERITHGQVPATSWLGTRLGRAAWEAEATTQTVEVRREYKKLSYERSKAKQVLQEGA
jgi:hypothetical protein